MSHDDGITQLPTDIGPHRRARGAPHEEAHLALAVVWSLDEPGRVGEVLLVGPPGAGPCFFGRSSGRDDQDRYVGLVRQRPASSEETGPIRALGVSRRQLRLQPLGPGRLHVENVGRCALLRGASKVSDAVLRPGELVELQGQIQLLCLERPATLPALTSLAMAEWPPFGEPDRHGLVGESQLAWELRERLAFVAERAGHVLVVGPSGTGKELAARAIHARSSRAGRTLVARNAATFPPGLIDAELFGNVRDFPNVGMRERPGLIGEASGSTLFLDEIGELPAELQTHLLRVLDADGEYQRLGESQRRRADLRLIAATNRAPETLKPDLRARLRHTVKVGPLSERREDIPLIAHALLRSAAAQDDHVRARFCDPGGVPRIGAGLMRLLVEHPLALNVRELDALLWQSIAESRGGVLEPPRRAPAPAPADAADTADDDHEGFTSPLDVTPEQVQECLDRHAGVQGPVWRELGFKNRYVLRRLVRKHGLRTADDDGEGGQG